MQEFIGLKVIEEFEAITKDAETFQRETLKKILTENGSAEYLQSLGLNGRTDPESYRACVPIVTYKDLEPYIQRIAGGEASPILTGEPIKTMSVSSGTTEGKPKLVPFNDKFIETVIQVPKTSFAYRNREFPIGINGKSLEITYKSNNSKTKGGLDVASVTTNIATSSQYKTSMKPIQSLCCSPKEVIFGSDFNQSLYCHLLCGLIFRDEIQFISSIFAHNIVLAFKTFEQVWEELCYDIRTGVLSSRITVPDVRSAVTKLMIRPNPELADLIYKKCKGLSKCWYGLIPEVFPNVKYIYGVMTGSMEHYLKKLKHYAGEVPLVSSSYGASEGWIGANIKPKLPPELVTYVVFPNIGYFEFLPVSDKTESKAVGLTEVKVGEEYEIVVTNVLGLYRYRIGDVVKVMGFHNSSPELKFVRRRNLILNINIDKSTEKDLQLAVEEAAKLLVEERLEVVDYTSLVECSSVESGHYVIFWELNGEGSDEVLGECCNRLDKSFADAGYVYSRKINTIGALELRIVRSGTFQKILEHFVASGGSASQLKTPRCVGPANIKVLQILSSNVVKSYFSTAYQ
ncbi:hypothetical protein FNV43_RR26762 [Rhamnella rubrinervis]|uniref:Jasmonic acid-amido synthetase JAR1 n=1 Tax=Rhamnella rubrinervis TaxID=2594499 RepID=A0A8K0DN62_9ROSA|nr:hypothetical protein FNV43_RR26762 [Rhamnella rubrinervis]